MQAPIAMTDDPTLWPATRQALAIASGQLKSRDLMEAMINRIDSLSQVNAVVTTDFDDARKRADEADAAVARGGALPPLHGLPITIKDALKTRGLRSTGGATQLANHLPDRDAPVVQAVKDAGAIIIGKTNLPEWSGDLQTYNTLFGTTGNPWNTDRVPGGSSGGAAAAVATGMTAFEIGTDIGGSIRFPASFCGVYGHKPSFGVVPSTGYLDHSRGGTTEADINVIGPIARSADDLQLLLDLLRRRGPLTANLPQPRTEASNMRVAAWLDDAFCPIDGAVRDCLEAAVARLEASGVHVDHSARPALDPLAASTLGMSLVGEAIMHDETPANPTSHHDWLHMDRERQSIRAAWHEFFGQWDAVLMPVCFIPPFEHLQEGNFVTRTVLCNGAERPYSDLVRWTILTGMAYLPATVPPIGRTADGLPIGMQVVSDYGRDLTTIYLGGFLGDLMGGFEAPPMVPVS